MESEARKKDLKKAALIALLLHIGLAVLFYFFIVGFKTIPPPDEQWVEMGMTDFSDFEQSAGSAASSSSSSEEQQSSEEVTQDPVEQPQQTEQVETQESSEVSTQTTQEPDPDPEPTVSNALDNILNKIDSDDDDDDDDGPNSDDDDDDDDSNSNGPRSGPGFDLEGFGGRGLVGKPRLSDDHDKEGVVCLKLVADRDGVITEATYRPDCSTTTSSDLIARARSSVMGVKLIAAKPSAPSRDIGKITITFKLQ